MIQTISVTQLRDRLAETIAALAQTQAVMVVRNSKPAAFLISAEHYESLLKAAAPEGAPAGARPAELGGGAHARWE